MTDGNPNKSGGDPTINGNDVRNNCCCRSGKWIWIVLIIAIAAALVARQAKVGKIGAEKDAVAPVKTEQMPPAPKNEMAAMERSATAPVSSKSRPRLVDLGAGKCIPCKMMAPILEDLKKNHADKFEVQFIDVWQNPDEAKKFNIRVIPTQMFFTPDGKELFRHEGFFGKDDILAKWKELGF